MTGLTKGKGIAVIEETIKEFPAYLKTKEDVFNCSEVPGFTAEMYFLPLVYEKLTRIWPERRYALDVARLCDDIRIAFAAGEGNRTIDVRDYSEAGGISGLCFKLKHREWFISKCTINYNSYADGDGMKLTIGYEDYVGVPWIELVWKDSVSPEAVVEIDNMMDDVLEKYLNRIISMVKKEEARRHFPKRFTTVKRILRPQIEKWKQKGVLQLSDRTKFVEETINMVLWDKESCIDDDKPFPKKRNRNCLFNEARRRGVDVIKTESGHEFSVGAIKVSTYPSGSIKLEWDSENGPVSLCGISQRLKPGRALRLIREISEGIELASRAFDEIMRQQSGKVQSPNTDD